MFQSYGSSFMKYSFVKGFAYVTSTFESNPWINVLLKLFI